jgi:methyl-accepting chemotaxis protein
MKIASLLRLTLAAFALGAGSALFGAQEELAAAIQQARNETIATHNDLIVNIKALNALVAQKEGDLRPAYEAFTASLKGTRAAAEHTAQRVQLFHEGGDKHFATWQQEIQTIKDDGIRGRAVKRMTAARKNWDGAGAALQEATTQFPSLLGYLADIEKALSYDLTADGVKSVRGAAQSANDTFGRIQQLTEKAVSELDELTASMSSSAKS